MVWLHYWKWTNCTNSHHPDGATVDKVKIFWIFMPVLVEGPASSVCRQNQGYLLLLLCEMSHHQSTSSLKHRLCSNTWLVTHHLWQCTRKTPNLLCSTSSSLVTMIAKYVATACSWVNMVEDEGVWCEMIKITSKYSMYVLIQGRQRMLSFDLII